MQVNLSASLMTTIRRLITQHGDVAAQSEFATLLEDAELARLDAARRRLIDQRQKRRWAAQEAARAEAAAAARKSAKKGSKSKAKPVEQPAAPLTLGEQLRQDAADEAIEQEETEAAE